MKALLLIGLSLLLISSDEPIGFKKFIQQIRRRKFLQDSIETEYERRYNSRDLVNSMTNYFTLAFFKQKKNTIDSLRIPSYSDDTNSYFIKDNIPWDFCLVNDKAKQEIGDIKEKIYRLK
jgi:hypothetical protein